MFHETFWVVTGTVAPVIALAAVVSFGDLGDEERRWYGEMQKLWSYMAERLTPVGERSVSLDDPRELEGANSIIGTNGWAREYFSPYSQT